MDIIDLHCDTLYKSVTENMSFGSERAEAKPNLDPDAHKLQCYAVWIPDGYSGDEAEALFLKAYKRLQSECAANNIKIIKPHEPLNSFRENQNTAYFTVENGIAVNGKLENIKLLSDCGVRMMTLTWNAANQIGSGADVQDAPDLSGFGKAVQRMTIPFPADYVKENFPKVLSDLTKSEECREIISGLIFSGAQKISLLYDAEGKLVRINYDGTVGESEETLRKVSLVWKVLREDEHQKDSISLKTPAIKGADKDNIALEREIDSSDSALGKYMWDIQIDHRAGKEDKKQTHFSAQLTDADSVISGNMEYNIKRDGKNPKTKVYMQVREEKAGEYKGTIEIADYSGKIEKNRILIHSLLQKGEAVKWPEAGLTKAETARNNEIDPKNEPEDTIAGIFIQKLFELPEEDLTYFSNEIPASMWLELVH